MGVGDLTCSGLLCKNGVLKLIPREVLISNQSITSLLLFDILTVTIFPPGRKDTNGEVLWVWCYPSTTATLRNLLLRKCCLTDENKLLHPFVFGQYRRTWFYHQLKFQILPFWKRYDCRRANKMEKYSKWCKIIPITLSFRLPHSAICFGKILNTWFNWNAFLSHLLSIITLIGIYCLIDLWLV